MSADQTTQEGLRLTSAQRRLWALAQLRPDDPFFNIPFVLGIEGPLDRLALERAVSELVRRHQALRTRIRLTDSGLVQTAEPAYPVALPTEDLTDSPAKADELTEAFAQEPFSVDGGPLFRARLLRLGEHTHRLLVSVHHIVFDGQSLQVFADELVALYGAFAAGRPSPLGEPSVGTAEYLNERTAMDERELSDSLRYWTERLTGAPELLELPIIGPRPVHSRRVGARRTRLLPERLLEPLRQLARSRRSTMYMVLKSAWDVVLHQYGCDDVLVGMALSGRDSTETATIVGYLARPVVLRTVIDADQTFTGLLAQVRGDVLDAHDHPDLPFEAVLDALGAARDPSYDPLYQVMFNYQPDEPVRSVGDVEFTLAELPLTSLKTELSIGLIERADGLLAEIDYRVDLFHAADVDRMLARLEAVLERVVADPDTAVCDLLPTAAELREVEEWSRSGAASTAPACVHRLVERQAALTPDAIAVQAGERRWSYRELDAAADRWGRRLRKLGVGAEDRVSICLPASAALPAVLLGVLKAGGVCVPLDPAQPAYQLRTVIDDTEPQVIIADRRSAALLDHTRSRVLELDAGELWTGDDTPDSAAPAADVLPAGAAAVLYTAGWSGEPRAVVLEHANLAHTVSWGAESIREGQSVPVAGPPTTVAGLTSLLGALAHGAVLTVPERSGQPATAAWPLAVPGRPEYALYATAESAGVAVAGPRGADEPTVIGRPLGDVRAYVLDARLRPVPPGTVGELHLGGAVVTRGYLHMHAETAERYLPDPFSGQAGQRMYATGDLVRHRPDGRLEFVSRAGQRLRVRGCTVAPGNLEAAMVAHPDVDRACALVVAGEAGRLLGLAVVLRAGSTASVAELRAYLAEHLPDYLLPGPLGVLDALPRLPGGALDRRAVERMLAKPAAEQAPEPPSDETEQLVASAWAAVLGRSVGADQNFFDVGGNSLLLVRLREELRTALGRELGVVELFRHSTVRAMAAFIGGGAAPDTAGTTGSERGQARQEALRARSRARRPEQST